MAKEKKAKPPMPTTPEELAALMAPPPAPSGPSTPIPAALQGPQGELLTEGKKPAQGQTQTIPANLQGPQGELLTGMPPAGAPTEIPLEMRGAQGELLTGMPTAMMPPQPPGISPKVAAPPAAGSKAETPGKPDLAAFFGRTAGEEPSGKSKKGKGEFWKRLGTLAKNTGRTVAELLQAAMFGYTGSSEPLEYQIRQQRETDVRSKEADRAFEERMAQINREWQTAQYQARDANELEREKMRLQQEAQQAALNRQSSEKIAGLKGGKPGAGGPMSKELLVRKYLGGE